jgi:uncharacterized membrane protein
MILPQGFQIPPPQYSVPLFLAALLVGAVLYRLDPDVSRPTILAFAPWMVAGSAMHALHIIFTEIEGPTVPEPPGLPLLGVPAVYVTTFVLAGTVWAVSVLIERRLEPNMTVPQTLGLSGLGIAIVFVVMVLWHGIGLARLTLFWPGIGLVVAIAITLAIRAGLDVRRPNVLERTGDLGTLVIFAHSLDGVSTAVGVDVFHSTERSPIPAAIMKGASVLPGTEVIGVGWSFLLLKLVIATGVVILFADYIEEAPRQG